MLLLLAALSALTGLASGLYSAKDDVLELTDKDFDKTVLKGSGLYLVEFYAPWCGHCKSLAPEWKKAAKALKGIINIVAVDADQHKSLAQKYGIQGFPTIKVFGENKNAPTDYQGGRDAAAIVNWALGQAQQLAKARLGGKPSSSGGSKSGDAKPKADRETGGGKHVVTLTPENFDQLVYGGSDAWMVEFYAPWCGHCKSLAPEWAAAAAQTAGEGVKFGAVDADKYKELGQRFGVRGFPTIKTFKAGSTSDSDAKDYNGARQAADLAAAGQALVAQGGGTVKVTQLTSQAVWEEQCGAGNGKRVCLLAVLPHILDENAAKRNNRIAALSEAAGKLRGKPFRFLWLEVGSQPKLEAALNVGLTPALYALTSDKPVFSTHKGSFEAGAIASFGSSLFTGKAATAPLPKGFEVKGAIEKGQEWDGKDGKKPVEEDEEL